jgi:hypothetical protein
MAGYCSTGQSTQRAVVLMEEEEEEEEETHVCLLVFANKVNLIYRIVQIAYKLINLSPLASYSNA